MVEEKTLDDYITWYKQERPLYELLVNKVKNLLVDILDSAKVDYHTIEGRAKSVESYSEKLRRIKLDDPRQMQDLCGLRVIGYVMSDVEKISEVIKNNFTIDEKRSKDIALGVDKVGYRSKHLVVTLPQTRTRLPEYNKFSGLCFEIQIRSILQHAWAEINHDRNYKFSGKLPDEIQRRFNLLAGTLELVDYQFEEIARMINDYSQKVSDKTKTGELDIPINTTSLTQFLTETFGDLPLMEHNFGYVGVINEVLNELTSMKIKTLKDLDEIIPKELKKVYAEMRIGTTFAGVIRDILIIHDTDRYFKDAWERHFTQIDSTSLNLYEKFGVEKQKVTKYIKPS